MTHESHFQEDDKNKCGSFFQWQSQEAALSEKFANIRVNFLKGAKGLCAHVKAASPNAKIVFHQTWARRADYWKNSKADLNLGKDPREMLPWNQKWYRQVRIAPKVLLPELGRFVRVNRSLRQK